jgi:hypothetical protein
VIKPTYGGAGAGAVLGRNLSRRELDEWAGRIVREPDEHTVQAYLPLSQMPTWTRPRRRRAHRAALAAAARVRGVRRRATAGACCPAAWPASPARWRSPPCSAAAAAPTPGCSPRARSTHQPAAPRASPRDTPHRKRTVTSRAAENLFWLGRYTERTENTARLARLAIESLNGEDQSSQPLLAWLSEAAVATAGAAGRAGRHAGPPRVRALADRRLAHSDRSATSVGYNLRGAAQCGGGGARAAVAGATGT